MSSGLQSHLALQDAASFGDEASNRHNHVRVVLDIKELRRAQVLVTFHVLRGERACIDAQFADVPRLVDGPLSFDPLEVAVDGDDAPEVLDVELHRRGGRSSDHVSGRRARGFGRLRRERAWRRPWRLRSLVLLSGSCCSSVLASRRRASGQPGGGLNINSCATLSSSGAERTANRRLLHCEFQTVRWASLAKFTVTSRYMAISTDRW